MAEPIFAFMLRACFVLLTVSLFASQARAQRPCLVLVSDGDSGIPGATVWLDGRPVGATNGAGEWRWESGEGHLRIQALGYEQALDIPRCVSGRQTVVLNEATYALGGATVVGSMSPARLKESPIRTTVLASTTLNAVPAQDLVESLDFTNGIRETIGCGVCGTNSVQLNGMGGVYSLVLVDGVPMLGGLASAYALDGIPLSMIQQVEVIQGPASARFGSQAVGGVINVVLAPLHRGDAFALLRLDRHGRWQSSGSAVFGREDALWQVGLDGIRFRRRIDDNEDGFTDAPTIDRVVTTLRHQLRTAQRRSRWTGRFFAEERFGGDTDFREIDRGTQNVYGERIDLHRAEVTWGSSPTEGAGWTFQGGGAFHRQESTYGTTTFNAQEWTTNLDAYHTGWSWQEGHRLRGGASLLWDVYADETPAASDMNVWVPALFAEYAGEAGKWSWIHGMRVERPSDQGMVVAPRVNVKWAPQPLWDLRLNAGRGYRRVHLFTEEHAALDGSREVILAEGGLAPESSWNANVNATRTLGGDRWTGSMSLQAHTTVFTDRIYADYDSLANAILYRTIEGLGWNRGLSADAWVNGTRGWQASLGASWMRSELFESGFATGEGEPVEFAPRWTTNANVGQTRGSWGWNLVAQTVGRMAVPYYDDTFTDVSEPYALIHVSGNRSWSTDQGGRHTLTAGIQNVSDATQRNPLLGVEDPFGDGFDASRVYGPLEGRRVFVEWRWRLEGR